MITLLPLLAFAVLVSEPPLPPAVTVQDHPYHIKLAWDASVTPSVSIYTLWQTNGPSVKSVSTAGLSVTVSNLWHSNTYFFSVSAGGSVPCVAVRWQPASSNSVTVDWKYPGNPPCLPFTIQSPTNSKTFALTISQTNNAAWIGSFEKPD